MITSSVKKYMGLIDEGVAVMISLKLGDKIFDSIYWYDADGRSVLTIEKDMQTEIGCVIEEYTEYDQMMKDISGKVSKIDDELTEKLERII